MSAQIVTLDDEGLAGLAARAQAVRARASGRRVLLGLGGIAGSGKSTLAERLAAMIRGAVVIGLDGFHLPNAVLHEHENFGRKGAPDTYDAAGFIALLRRYGDAAATGPYPIYDRQATHEPITAPDLIDASVHLIIAEGQFMLLNQPPWDELADILDECWFMETPMDTARDWILSRHTATGRTPAEASLKYDNDRRNSELVLANMRPPDLHLRWPA